MLFARSRQYCMRHSEQELKRKNIKKTGTWTCSDTWINEKQNQCVNVRDTATHDTVVVAAGWFMWKYPIPNRYVESALVAKPIINIFYTYIMYQTHFFSSTQEVASNRFSPTLLLLLLLLKYQFPYPLLHHINKFSHHHNFLVYYIIYAVFIDEESCIGCMQVSNCVMLCFL